MNINIQREKPMDCKVPAIYGDVIASKTVE